MKNCVSDFFRRGLSASGLGPVVLVIIYVVLQYNGYVDTLSVNEVCLGIISLSALAFIAGGMNIVYQIERLPLMVAIFIHGSVLYVAYLATYLLNGWLEKGITPILVFTAIFAFGYIAIWIVIYSVMKKHTSSLNEKLNQKKQMTDM